MAMHRDNLLPTLDEMVNIVGDEFGNEPAMRLRAVRCAVESLLKHEEYLLQVRHHQQQQNDRLIQMLAAIKMRCAPDDVTLDDGRTMRFVPPDPELYWRELSEKINGISEEFLTSCKVQS